MISTWVGVAAKYCSSITDPCPDLLQPQDLRLGLGEKSADCHRWMMSFGCSYSSSLMGVSDSTIKELLGIRTGRPQGR